MEHPKVRNLSDEQKKELEPIITRYAKRVKLKILAHCNRDDLPEALESVVAEITEEMLMADKVIATDNKEVASVSRGDTSITYKDPASAYNNAIDFMKDYLCQLVHFKRMRLPRDPNDGRS
ncbi:translation initiation factor 2 [Eubacterium sp. TM05-53]|nr:translation initiation factor 2 [Eubacterium sp. TM05-53]